VVIDHLKDHLEILQEAHWEDQIAIPLIEVLDLGRRMRKRHYPLTKKRMLKSCSQL
jgi:hypothetical protein